LSYCYFHKKAYYLAVIASKLSKTKEFSNISFATLNGNSLKPIIIIRGTDGKIIDFLERKKKISLKKK